MTRQRPGCAHKGSAAIGRLRLGVLAALSLALVSCGYSHKELFPTEYQSVSLPIFENRTFFRGIENDLTEALVKEIELRTPYKVVSAGSAGTALEGTVTRVDQDMLSRRRRGGVPQELEITIAVDFTWKDLRTGQVIRERRNFESVARYVPTSPVGQPYEIAQHLAVERLAEDIVSTMQADW